MLSIQLIGILKTTSTSAFKYTEGLAKSQAKIKNRYGFIKESGLRGDFTNLSVPEFNS